MKMLLFGKTRTLNQKKKFILDRRQSGKKQDTMTQKVKVSLSKNWQEVLKKKYKVKIIVFEENEVLIDEHVEG